MKPMPAADQTVFATATATTDCDDAPLINVMQVISLNLCCSVLMTASAAMFGAHWLTALAIGWLGGGIATLVTTVALVTFTSISSQLRTTALQAEADETLATLAAWDKDQAEDRTPSLNHQETLEKLLETQAEGGEYAPLPKQEGDHAGRVVI